MMEEIYIIKLRDFYLKRESQNLIGLSADKTGLELRKEFKDNVAKFEK